VNRDSFKRCVGSAFYDDLLILEGMKACYRDLIDDFIELRCTNCGTCVTDDGFTATQGFSWREDSLE